MRIQIPAHSIAKISIKLDGEPNGEMYLTQMENPYDDLIIYDTIGEADEHGRTQIFVGNPGSRPNRHQPRDTYLRGHRHKKTSAHQR